MTSDHNTLQKASAAATDAHDRELQKGRQRIEELEAKLRALQTTRGAMEGEQAGLRAELNGMRTAVSDADARAGRQRRNFF